MKWIFIWNLILALPVSEFDSLHLLQNLLRCTELPSFHHGLGGLYRGWIHTTQLNIGILSWQPWTKDPKKAKQYFRIHVTCPGWKITGSREAQPGNKTTVTLIEGYTPSNWQQVDPWKYVKKPVYRCHVREGIANKPTTANKKLIFSMLKDKW